MAKKTTKTQIAALETETSNAVQFMALDMLDEASAEAIVELEAIDEALIEDEANIDPVLEVQADGEIQSFDDMMANISDEAKIEATVKMANAVDERADFELANGNDNIQKTLKKARAQLSSTRAGAVLLACGVTEAFVNRSVHDGKRYNVYAFGKLADAIVGLSGGEITNKINFAIMRSLFACRKAGITFTGELAKAAASDKIRVEGAVKAILIRHTVGASTAPTQASSTMQALETLGIVKRSGSHKNPTFELTDHPAVAKLEAVLAKAA
jgi:hypothetical protein